MIAGGDTRLVAALGEFCDARSRDSIAAFFAAHKLPGAVRTLDQTIERVNNCIELQSKQTPAVTTWLAAVIPAGGGAPRGPSGRASPLDRRRPDNRLSESYKRTIRMMIRLRCLRRFICCSGWMRSSPGAPPGHDPAVGAAAVQRHRVTELPPGSADESMSTSPDVAARDAIQA